MKIKTLSLYFHFLFNKIVILSIILSLSIISIILFLLAKNTYEMPSYLYNYNDIHINYFRLSYFIIMIFNLIIIALISITYTNNSSYFDILFISSNSKIKIPLVKVFCGFLVIIIISSIEYLILSFIEVFYFRYYIFKIKDLFTLYQIIIMGLLSYIISLSINTIINQTIIPLLIMLISIILKLICNNMLEFKNYYEKVLPYYSYNENIYDKTGSFLALIWVILLVLFYVLIYNIKDIKC